MQCPCLLKFLPYVRLFSLPLIKTRHIWKFSSLSFRLISATHWYSPRLTRLTTTYGPSWYPRLLIHLEFMYSSSLTSLTILPGFSLSASSYAPGVLAVFVILHNHLGLSTYSPPRIDPRVLALLGRAWELSRLLPFTAPLRPTTSTRHIWRASELPKLFPFICLSWLSGSTRRN